MRKSATPAGLVLEICLVLAALADTAHAGKFVWRKPGLWEVRLWAEDQDISKAVTVRQCSDAPSEPDVLLSIVPGQEQCAKPKMVQTAQTKTLTTECLVHSTILKSEITLSGDFSQSYRGRFEVHFLPKDDRAPPAPPTRFDAQWVGPCKPEMRPGDMVLSNGITVNVLKDKQTAATKPAYDFRKTAPGTAPPSH